jgi:pilus assembly protein FimV
MDLDLDLDFSLDEESAPASSDVTAINTESDAPALELDFGLATQAMMPFEPPQKEVAQEVSNEIEFSLPDLEVETTAPEVENTDLNLSFPSPETEDFQLPEIPAPDTSSPEPLDISEPEVPSAPDLGMLEFDLGDLSLDLDEAPEPALASGFGAHEDPLSTKLALAEEFSAIGDDDGARALIEEVLAEATGDMKIKAQRALSNL